MRAHGVEVDVAVAAQRVGPSVDQTGLVAALPQGTCAAVAGIEQADMAAAQGLHQPGDGARRGRGQQQVDVIVHQHPSMQRTAGALQALAQQLPIARPVHVVQDAGQAVVAALHHLLRNTGQVQTGQAGHGASLRRASPRRERPILMLA